MDRGRTEQPEGARRGTDAVVARGAASAPDAGATPAAKEPGSIEIVIGGASVRVEGRVDARVLAVVIKALRVAS